MAAQASDKRPRSRAVRKRRAAPVRRRQPDKKRAEIIGAASELFVRGGYESTTTAQIARQAGVSEGAVFHHFASKADLLTCCGERCAASLAGLITEWRKLQPGRPDFEAMFRFLFAWARAQREVIHVMYVAGKANAGGIGAGPRGLLVDAITENFAHWSAQGFLRPMEPRIVAELLGSVVETALENAFVFGPDDEERHEAYLLETVRCIELATGTETITRERKKR